MMMKKHRMKLGRRLKLERSCCKNKIKMQSAKAKALCKDWWHEKVVAIAAVTILSKEISVTRDSVLRSLL
jgi:hypothetical protein